MGVVLKSIGFVSAAAVAASFVVASPASAAATVPKVYARTAQHWVSGVTPVTFFPGQYEDLSAVTQLTLYADGKEVGTDTAAPWGIDWNTAGFDGLVRLSTRATTDNGSRTTDGYLVMADNKAPTGLTLRFPRLNNYIGRGGAIVVDATDNGYVVASELVVGGAVVSAKDQTGGGNLDLAWDVTVPNGKTAMTVRVRDMAGNVTALTRTVTVDNNRPVITGSNTGGSAVRGDLKVSLSGYQDASPFAVFEASLDSAAHLRSYSQEKARTVTINTREVPDGKYTLGWHAFDGAGNEAILKRPVIVDNKAPTVSITKAPKHKAKVKKKFTVTAKAGDTYGVAKVQVLVNGKVVQTDTRAGYSFTVDPKKYGKKFTVRVRAYDKAGNVRYSPTRTYQR